MGGMCARVCPTETLCEEACVREAAEGKPVRIGLLQRYAVDAQMETGKTSVHPRRADAASASRSSARGRRASPARMRSRSRATKSTIFEAREKSGGLNEYGIAAYKTPDDFAARRPPSSSRSAASR